MMGGLRIPYATTPTNSRTGMTIGGTRNFMRFPDYQIKRTLLAAPAGQRRRVVDAGSQHAGENCGAEGEAGEQYHGLPIFLLVRPNQFPPLQRCRFLVRQKLYQPLADDQIVR